MSHFLYSTLFAKTAGLEETLASLAYVMYRPISIADNQVVVEPLLEVVPLPQVVAHLPQVVAHLPEVVPLPEVSPIPEVVPLPIENSILPSDKRPILKPRQMAKLYISDKEDTLFWAIYIYVYGYGAYQEIGSKYKNIELSEKQKIMIHLKANPSTYKTGTNYKLTNIEMQEIMSDLMTNRKTSLLTVYVLCAYYKMPIFLVKDALYRSNSEMSNLKYMYHDFIPNGPDVTDTNCVIYYRHGKYGIYLVEDDSVPIFNKDFHFRMETIYKPLAGVSKYKMNELEDIFDKLVKPLLSEEELSKKWKKGDIYNAILEKCVW